MNNLQSCRRCGCLDFRRIERLRDGARASEHGSEVVWLDRAVRVDWVTAGAPHVQGYFEGLACSRCGLTEWFAKRWAAASTAASQRPCAPCGTMTDQVRIDSYDHVAHGGLRRARVPLGRNLVDGFVTLHLCTACDHVCWSAFGVDSGPPLPERPRHVVLDAPACLTCGSREAALDEPARDDEGVLIPILVGTTPDHTEGTFVLRVCDACGDVEWYARGLEGIPLPPVARPSSGGTVPVSAPICPRCAGTRFFHVTRVMERGQDARYPYQSVHTWLARPVGVQRADVPPRSVGVQKLTLRGEYADPVGHFETIVCRRCGHSSWLAREWQTLASPERTAACRRCEATTRHAQREAVETGGLSYEPMRLTHGMLGREGFVDLELCTACGLVTWRARDYLHVVDRGVVHHYEDGIPCLACAATRALVVEAVREHDGAPVVVATHEKKVLHFFDYRSPEGRFALRVCTSCHVIEWTALRLDEIEIDPAQGVFALGDGTATSAEGPYR